MNEITMTEFVKRGKMIVRRDALDFDDPDHPYQVLKAQGVQPEDYGYYQPVCPCCGIRADEARRKYMKMAEERERMG